MTQNTRRSLTILLLAAAAAWFLGLRGWGHVAFVSAERVIDGIHLAAAHPLFTGPLDDVSRLEQVPARPYSLVELSAQFGKYRAPSGSLPPAAAPQPAAVRLGESTSFWVSDGPVGETYRVTATLRYIGDHTLMYVDNTITVDQQALEQAARDFETTVYPRSLALFGSQGFPGQDSDPRLTILHTPLSTAGGYFSQTDTEPLEVNRFSNQRLMFVIGADSYLPGDEGYLRILAHEFQHMIHTSRQPQSPAWFNEGLSMLSQDLNGFEGDELALIYLSNPDLGLIDWSQDASETGEHYGAAQLFLRYFFEQYGGAALLPELLRLGAGSQPQVFADLAAQSRPDIRSFTDLVADWAAANLVNDAGVGDGRYAYDGLPAYAAVQDIPSRRFSSSVSQLGVDYLELGYGPLQVDFDGADAVALTGARPQQGEWMWWSGRGDSRVATLTRAFDLRGVEKATLQFSAWHELERDFDYAYVTVSVDGGHTWQSLAGRGTTLADPQGANLGNGLTGVSGRPGAVPEIGRRGRWLHERMDLVPFTGQEILLRFWVVNDPAYNAQGLLLDELRIPEIGYYEGEESGSVGGWQAEGFVRTTGGIPQEWALRLAVETDHGIEVRPVALDAHNRALLALAPGERGVLVVIGASPFTDEPARYRLALSAPRTSLQSAAGARSTESKNDPGGDGSRRRHAPGAGHRLCS